MCDRRGFLIGRRGWEFKLSLPFLPSRSFDAAPRVFFQKKNRTSDFWPHTYRIHCLLIRLSAMVFCIKWRKHSDVKHARLRTYHLVSLPHATIGIISDPIISRANNTTALQTSPSYHNPRSNMNAHCHASFRTSCHTSCRHIWLAKNWRLPFGIIVPRCTTGHV